MKKRFGLIIAAAVLIFAGIAPAVVPAPIRDLKEKTVYNNDFTIILNGRQVLELTNSRGEIVRPFIYNDTAYAPLAAIAEALGAEAIVHEDCSRIVTVWDFWFWCPAPGMPRVEGNRITTTEWIMIGFQFWDFELIETIPSGVTWEFVSVSTLECLWDPQTFDDLYAGDFVWLERYEYLQQCEVYAVRRFIFAFCRNIPVSFFTITFEQVLDGRRLNNFIEYDVIMIAECGRFTWPR